jgi:hypothetical protein
MDFIETRVFREPWDVDRRLAELGLTRKGLLEIRDGALNESANATPFHAANAAGTFAYHYGSWGLRHRYAGHEWAVDRSDGIEAIRNDARSIKVAYCNVDLAGDNDHTPQPRSKKGSGAERASSVGLFVDLPQFAPRPSGSWALYYLMVDQDGVAELTRPVVRGDKFVAPIERIHLSDVTDGGDEELIVDDSDDTPVFDPQVVRK